MDSRNSADILDNHNLLSSNIGDLSNSISPENELRIDSKEEVDSSGQNLLVNSLVLPDFDKAIDAQTINNGGNNLNYKAQPNDFVRKIYQILEHDEYPDIVRWTENGENFVVLDTGKFTTNILPNHFKHTNFASFVRQLNKYDFHKVKRTQEERKNCRYGELSWEFTHPLFKRGNESELDNIKRKVTIQKRFSMNDSGFLANSESTQEREQAIQQLMNNTVSIESFNQLKKKVEGLEKDLLAANDDSKSARKELQKLNNKYYTVLQSLLTFRSVNDTLINNFNTLCQTLKDSGMEIPLSFQMTANQSSGDTPNMMKSQNVSPVSNENLKSTANAVSKNLNDVENDLVTLNATDKDENILKAGFHVLLVEDDEVSIKLCSKFLQKYGCTVQVVTDGLAAISILEKVRFDIVFMDIVMPNLDGATATSIIRNFDNETPIIAMTGSIEHQNLITYLQHGMNDILAKPFTKKDLFSMLTRYLKDRTPLASRGDQLAMPTNFDSGNHNQIEIPKDMTNEYMAAMMDNEHVAKKQRI